MNKEQKHIRLKEYLLEGITCAKEGRKKNNKVEMTNKCTENHRSVKRQRKKTTKLMTEASVFYIVKKQFTHHQSEQDNRLESTCLQCQFLLR